MREAEDHTERDFHYVVSEAEVCRRYWKQAASDFKLSHPCQVW